MLIAALVVVTALALVAMVLWMLLKSLRGKG
jgi:hypothetical protein